MRKVLSRPLLLSIGLALPLALLANAARARPNPRVADSVLGVRTGMSLDEARARLGRLGTPAGRDTREGGRKEAWTLRGTDYGSIALKTNSQGRVVWVTGFLRPGREIPFSELGDLSHAARATQSQAIWNVASPAGGYRLVAKGQSGKASVTSLLSLTPPH